ncbi:MAG: bifunctional YncE family protein/alkaline phosphatase family protein [Pyrinomonadaceae bacterium]
MKKRIGRDFIFCLSLIFLTNANANAQTASPLARNDSKQTKQTCLPTGVCLDAAGQSFDVGNMPLAMTLSPEGDRFVLSLNGWRQQGLQVVERDTGRVVQTIPQPGAFFGLAFSNDGRTLYASGGNEDVVYVYAWRDKQAMLVNRIVLAPKEPDKDGTRFPAGIALSTNGKKLYVAENLADSLAVIDLETNKIEQRLPTEAYPYAVAVAPGDKVFVSAWGGSTVSVFAQTRSGALAEHRRVPVGRHPSALLLNESGSRLFVASATTNRVSVIDTKSEALIANLTDAPPSKNQGSTPDALALSSDGTKLFVAEADNNAIAVFNLSKKLSGGQRSRGANRMLGRIPVEWYPTALLMTRDHLFVLNGKGKGTRPNPQFRQPDEKSADGSPDYTLGQLNGTMTTLPANVNNFELVKLTERVARANNWNQPTRSASKYPPFKHIIYVIKENRTYDQVLSDLPQGDGDTSLQFFPRSVSPNHHALAERFGLFDRFFVNAEVSSQGHVWSTAAYVTDYGEKTVPSVYANRRDGNERGDVDEPASGYLWNAAIKRGLSLRNYGEFAEPVPNKDKSAAPRYRASKAALIPYTSPDYASFDMHIPDQKRVDVWMKEFQEFVRKGNLPALEILHLPRDHTAGARAGLSTPKACFADNDLALGRMVEAVSHSPYWKDTAFFILEDDAQDGPDHVDSHRSMMFVISAYNRAGTTHRFVNTTDVFATMEEILGLPPLSQFDFYGRPLREIFADKPDLRPFAALKPEQSLDELNPSQGANARASLQLDLDEVDKADMDLFNRILWSGIKGDATPYPRAKRMSSLEMTRAH